jgi:S1-C subfamily serine protease
MRARWSWVEGGTVVKSAGFIIPYDQVSMILLQHYPSLEKSFRWGLNVYIKGSSTVSIRTPARDSAERLGKAIHALARARGAEITIPNPRFGAAVAPLSEAQAKAAGISWPGGLIISWVFRDSRAERAGFSAQDIITNVAGSAVFKGEDLFASLDKAEKAGDKNIKIQGLRRSYRLEADKYIEIFVPLTYVLPIDTPQGGSK